MILHVLFRLQVEVAEVAEVAEAVVEVRLHQWHRQPLRQPPAAADFFDLFLDDSALLTVVALMAAPLGDCC